jgi:type II secretory pathway component PulM
MMVERRQGIDRRHRSGDTHFHFTFHFPEFTSLDRKLDLVFKQGEQIMAALDALTREVEETRTVADSAIVLLKNLAQMIRDNVGNAGALTKLANDLDAKQAELATAITENTPAEEPPVEPPPA